MVAAQRALSDRLAARRHAVPSCSSVVMPGGGLIRGMDAP
jgi:hypothetical protein